LGVLMVMTAGVALAVHDNDLFELDENAVDEAAAGDDWSPAPAGALEFQFATDPAEDPEDDIFAGSNKDTLDIADFQWKFGEPNDKNDIEHGYIAAYEDDGDQILYFGMDFLANNGDKAVGVWVLQDDVAQVEDSSPPNFPFTGGHIDGDILLQADFTNGGQLTRVDVYTWGENIEDNDQVGNTNLWKAFTGQECSESDALDDACAEVNQASEIAPWDYQYKCVGNAQPMDLPPPDGCQGVSGVQSLDIFPVATFFEGGVNVTSLLGNSICAGSVMFETRQSQSETAALEDKLIAPFDLCSIAVDKTGPALSKVGDDAEYTITITNDGAVTLWKQSIVDSVFGDLTDGTNAVITSSNCGASLAPNASCTIEVTYTVQEGDPDPLDNTVTVVYDIASTLDGDEVSDSDDHSVNLFQPAVEVTKSGDTLSKVGDDVTYTFAVENTSSADSPDLVLDSFTDTVLGDLTTATGYDTDCDQLASGDTCTFNVTYTVQVGDPDPLPNTVTVHYHPDGFPNDITDSDDHSVNLFQPAVEVVKSGDTLSKIGDEVTYDFTINNLSSGDSPNLVLDSVSDTVLGDLTATATANGCTSLASGGSCSFSVDYTIQAGDPDPLDNTVTVHYNPDGFPNDITDSDDHSVNLFQPSVEVTKSGDTLSKVGDDVTYTFAVENTSSADSPDLVLDSFTDTVLGDLTTATGYDTDCDQLASGDTCTFNVTYTVQVGDPDPLDNTVTVHYHPADFPNDITDSDDHSVNLFQPSVTIDKTGDTLSKVGDDVDYTITVANTSSSDSPNLTCDITDALLGINEQVNLVSGASHVINDSRTVQAGDPDPLVNTASVTCTVDGFSNVLGPLTDGHSTNLFQPDVEVVKTGPASATVGDTVTYDFTINNLSSGDSPNLVLDSVSDTVLGNLTATAAANGCSTLASGGTCNFTFDYTVIGTDPNPLVNVVTVHYHPVGFPNDITDDDDHSLEIIPPGEGCTPGWWKNQGVGAYDEATDPLAIAVEDAVESYWGAGWIYLGTTEGNDFQGTTDDLFRVAFNLTEAQMEARGLDADLTLLDAIELGGGGFKALARHGTAALLNSLSVNYEFDADEVLQDVHDAFVTGNLGTLVDDYNEANNRDHSSCPTGGDTATGSAGDLILLAVVPATIRRLLKEAKA
jgi:hypothetical protein